MASPTERMAQRLSEKRMSVPLRLRSPPSHGRRWSILRAPLRRRFRHRQSRSPCPLTGSPIQLAVTNSVTGMDRAGLNTSQTPESLGRIRSTLPLDLVVPGYQPQGQPTLDGPYRYLTCYARHSGSYARRPNGFLMGSGSRHARRRAITVELALT